MVEYKACTKCAQVLSLDNFYKGTKGLRSDCKKCFSKIRQKSYQNCKQKVLIKAKEYRQNNAEKIKQIQQKYRANNPEKVKQNIEKRRAYKANSNTFKIRTKELKRLLSRPCLYCGKKSEHLDHIIPLSRGGNHGIGNLVGACALCNRQKGNKFITEWKNVRGW